MENINIVIKGIGLYHPSKKVSNEIFTEEFGSNIKGLLKQLGRKNRYHVENLNIDNTLTMSVKAAKRAIADCGIKANQLDAIIFSSNIPEYLTPTTALKIHNKIGANANMVYDLNNNCTGLTTSLDTISRVMKANRRINKALIIGAEAWSKFQ